MKLECPVNRSLQTLLGEDVEYVIHHHHLSPVGDFSKNMKMGQGKKPKEKSAGKMEEEGPRVEGKERGK